MAGVAEPVTLLPLGYIVTQDIFKMIINLISGNFMFKNFQYVYGNLLIHSAIFPKANAIMIYCYYIRCGVIHVTLNYHMIGYSPTMMVR